MMHLFMSFLMISISFAGLSRTLVMNKEMDDFSNESQKEFYQLKQNMTGEELKQFEALLFQLDRIDSNISLMKTGLQEEFSKVRVRLTIL